MELIHDWRSFQTTFYGYRRGLKERVANGPLHVVADGDLVVSAYAEGEDVGDCVGASLREVAKRHENRRLIILDRENVDHLMAEAANLPHLYDQVEFFRAKVKTTLAGNGKSAGEAAVGFRDFRPHFLIDALKGWWAKILPSAYGVLIRTESEAGRVKDFLLVVRRGSFETFCEPGLSSLSLERRKDPAAAAKYLSEKYSVPVQAFVVSEAEWAEWSRNPNPWREIVRSIKAGRTKLLPFRWSLAFLSTTRAFFKI